MSLFALRDAAKAGKLRLVTATYYRSRWCENNSLKYSNMSTFGDAISFMPSKKSSKKVKPSKLSKHNKGKVVKLGKNGKPLKGKGRKPQQVEVDLGAAPGPSKAKKKEDAVDLEQQFILRMPPVSTFLHVIFIKKSSVWS